MRKLGLVVLVGLVGFLGLAPTAGAMATYVYEGNNFEVILDDDPPAGMYDTSMKVTGSFTLAAPLSPNEDALDIKSQILSLSFSDGRNTLTLPDLLFAIVSTDAAGDLTNWLVEVGVPRAGENPQRRIRVDRGSADNGLIKFNFVNAFDVGQVSDNPGTWTLIPEPATAGLLALGLAGLAASGRRQ